MKKMGFSGPRSFKLPWGDDELREDCINFKKKLKNLIEDFIKDGYTYFISGMAVGIDMICAEIVLELKKTYPKIVLECAFPCKNQEKLWSQKHKDRYHKILSNEVIENNVSDEEYFNGCMQKRNEYIVDNSDLLLAVYNNLGGGTKNTIDYANDNHKPIYIVNI